MWIWVAPILSAGAPEAVFWSALAWARPGRAPLSCPGSFLAVIGVAYSGLIVAIHADNGAPLARHYGYLATGKASGGHQ